MRPRTLAALVFVPLLAGCTSPASDPVSVATADDIPDAIAEVAAPAAGWQVGDHFATEVTERVAARTVIRVDGEVVSTEDTDENEPLGPGRDILVRAVDWALDGAPHFGVQLRLPGAEADQTRLVALRQADLRPSGLLFEGAAPDEATAPLALLQTTAAYQWVRFPLVPGTTWEGSIQDPGTDEAITISSEVLEPSFVTTPLGPVDVITVRHRAQLPMDDAFMEEMLEELREEDPDATLAFEGNFTYHIAWAPELQAIAKETVRADGIIDARWTSDGSERSMYMDIAWTLTETLTHRDHHPVDPIPQEDFVGAIAKPSAKTPVTYDVELEGLPDPALVGEAFDATARSEVEGDPPAPVRVVTEVVAPDGSTVAQGSDMLSVVLDEVGWYAVTATAYVEDQAVAWTAELVPVAAAGQGSLECPTATRPDEGCTPLTFPVTRWAGAVGTLLQASDGSPLGSTLIVSDADGPVRDVPVDDGSAEATLEDLQGLTRDGRDWGAAYNTTVEVAPEAEVVWTVLPDDAAVPDVTPPPGEDPLTTAVRMRLRPLLWDAPDIATLLTAVR